MPLSIPGAPLSLLVLQLNPQMQHSWQASSAHLLHQAGVAVQAGVWEVKRLAARQTCTASSELSETVGSWQGSGEQSLGQAVGSSECSGQPCSGQLRHAGTGCKRSVPATRQAMHPSHRAGASR